MAKRRGRLPDFSVVVLVWCRFLCRCRVVQGDAGNFAFSMFAMTCIVLHCHAPIKNGF
jgi:hypothetical protein